MSTIEIQNAKDEKVSTKKRMYVVGGGLIVVGLIGLAVALALGLGPSARTPDSYDITIEMVVDGDAATYQTDGAMLALRTSFATASELEIDQVDLAVSAGEVARRLRRLDGFTSTLTFTVAGLEALAAAGLKDGFAGVSMGSDGTSLSTADAMAVWSGLLSNNDPCCAAMLLASLPSITEVAVYLEPPADAGGGGDDAGVWADSWFQIGLTVDETLASQSSTNCLVGPGKLYPAEPEGSCCVKCGAFELGCDPTTTGEFAGCAQSVPPLMNYELVNAVAEWCKLDAATPGSNADFTFGTRPQRTLEMDGDISTWDTSAVTDMSNLFDGVQALACDRVLTNDPWSNCADWAYTCNPPIGSWDVSSVTKMNYMFAHQAGFNQPLNDWDTSSVEEMMFTFKDWDPARGATFNQPLNAWDVSSVTNMAGLFQGQVFFNQPLNDWDTSSVENFYGVFQHTVAFDQSLIDWDMSSMTNDNDMFTNATKTEL